MPIFIQLARFRGGMSQAPRAAVVCLYPHTGRQLAYSSDEPASLSSLKLSATTLRSAEIGRWLKLSKKLFGVGGAARCDDLYICADGY